MACTLPLGRDQTGDLIAACERIVCPLDRVNCQLKAPRLDAGGQRPHLLGNPGPASSTWPSSSKPMPSASSPDGFRGLSMPASCAMPWVKPCMDVGPSRAASCMPATAGASTCPSATRSGWRKRALSRRPAASATAQQGAGRHDQRPVQGRGHPSARPRARLRGGQVRHPRIG